ncbi:MAG: VOC family protein [Enhydrobacter sp.]
MNIQPYLSLDGRAQEAIDFYKEAIGAKVEMVMHFKDAPPEMQSQINPASRDKVMHACIKVGDTPVFLTDGSCNNKAVFSGVTLTLNADSDAQAEKLFKALTKDGGKETMPMTETFFATRFGMLADKFGVAWMILKAKQP